HAILNDAHRHQFRFGDVHLLILIRLAAIHQQKIDFRVELRLDALAVDLERDVLRFSHSLVPSMDTFLALSTRALYSRCRARIWEGMGRHFTFWNSDFGFRISDLLVRRPVLGVANRLLASDNHFQFRNPNSEFSNLFITI